jgi:hypothetical protein
LPVSRGLRELKKGIPAMQVLVTDPTCNLDGTIEVDTRFSWAHS